MEEVQRSQRKDSPEEIGRSYFNMRGVVVVIVGIGQIKRSKMGSG